MSYEKNKRGFFFVHEARLSSCSTARDAHLQKSTSSWQSDDSSNQNRRKK